MIKHRIKRMVGFKNTQSIICEYNYIKFGSEEFKKNY